LQARYTKHGEGFWDAKNQRKKTKEKLLRNKTENQAKTAPVYFSMLCAPQEGVAVCMYLEQQTRATDFSLYRMIAEFIQNMGSKRDTCNTCKVMEWILCL
jgi:hypothetical protein